MPIGKDFAIEATEDQTEKYPGEHSNDGAKNPTRAAEAEINLGVYEDGAKGTANKTVDATDDHASYRAANVGSYATDDGA